MNYAFTFFLVFALSLLSSCGEDTTTSEPECGPPILECTTDQDCIEDYGSEIYTCNEIITGCGRMTTCQSPPD